jgi:hypothetical protein
MSELSSLRISQETRVWKAKYEKRDMFDRKE